MTRGLLRCPRRLLDLEILSARSDNSTDLSYLLALLLRLQDVSCATTSVSHFGDSSGVTMRKLVSTGCVVQGQSGSQCEAWMSV